MHECAAFTLLKSCTFSYTFTASYAATLKFTTFLLSPRNPLCQFIFTQEIHKTQGIMLHRKVSFPFLLCTHRGRREEKRKAKASTAILIYVCVYIEMSSVKYI